ncbi:MAG: tetratricopeptide repeat protein [Elusimicrobiota bacterium]
MRPSAAILSLSIFLAAFPALCPAQTYDDQKPRCRPAGVMPQGKNPQPSCDPVKHEAIVTKRAYDRSEQTFEDTKESVERAEQNFEEVTGDSSTSLKERERARDALLRARAVHQEAKDEGRDAARAYKDAEDALKRDRGYHLNNNSYQDADKALELADVEENYNSGIEAAKHGKSSYGSGMDSRGKPILDKRGVPVVGAGGFVGGANTNARRKSRGGWERPASKEYQRNYHQGQKYKTGYDAGWEDGGGDYKELGGESEGRGRAKLAQARPAAVRSNDMYQKAPTTFGGRSLRQAERGSLGMVRGSEGGGLAMPSAGGTGEERRLGGPAIPFLHEAEAAMSQRDYPGAEQASRKALAVEPGSADAHLMHSRALNAMGLYKEAEAAAREALQRDPDNAAAYQELAWSMLHQGSYDAAVKMASLALRLDPNNAKAYLIRAFAYEQMGNRDLMLADLERAAGLNNKFQPHLQHAKNGGRLFDPTSKSTLSLLTGSPSFAMIEGKDPVKMSLFLLSALAIGIFAVWQFRRRRTG